MPGLPRRIYGKPSGSIILKAGEEQTIQLELGRDAFSVFDSEKNDWQFVPGKYELQVGASSREIVKRILITLDRY